MLCSSSRSTVRHRRGQPLNYNSFSKLHTYVPSAGFVGIDEFSYVARDEFGAEVAVQARITVHPVNALPVGTDWIATVADLSEPLVIDLIDLIAAAEDPDGDLLVLGAVPDVSLGGRIIDRSESVIAIHSGESGWTADSFDYVVGDGRGGSATITVDIVPPERIRSARFENETLVIEAEAIVGMWTVQRAESPLGPWSMAGTMQIGTDAEILRCRGVLVKADTLPPRDRGDRGQCFGSGEFRDLLPPEKTGFYRMFPQNRERN